MRLICNTSSSILFFFFWFCLFFYWLYSKCIHSSISQLLFKKKKGWHFVNGMICLKEKRQTKKYYQVRLLNHNTLSQEQQEKKHKMRFILNNLPVEFKKCILIVLTWFYFRNNDDSYWIECLTGLCCIFSRRNWKLFWVVGNYKGNKEILTKKIYKH